jgi:hypothetical protein
MLKIGEIKLVENSFSLNQTLTENTMLKNQKSDLIFTLVVTAGVAIALGYLYTQAMKKEIRISTPEKNNLNTK